MEFKHLAIALVLLATSMSGCLGLFGEDDTEIDPCEEHAHDDMNATEDHHQECTEEEHEEEEGGEDENVTSTPNMPAVIAFNVYNDTGAMVNSTVAGGNLTFSAAGTVDPDGQLQLVAMTLFDGNQTRVAALYSSGQFTDVTFNMDVAGVSNITINALDQRGEISTMEANVYTNSVQTTVGHTFSTGAPVGVDATACAGPGGDAASAITSTFTRVFRFEVKANATYVQATPTVTLVNAGAPGVEIAICDPEGNAISAGNEGVVLSTNGTAFVSSINYYVFAVSHAPQNAIENISILVGYDAYPTA